MLGNLFESLLWDGMVILFWFVNVVFGVLFCGS